MRKRIATILIAAGILGGTILSAAHADAPPPTNGGNGAGQSGQCTGNPDDRPNVCPATP